MAEPPKREMTTLDVVRCVLHDMTTCDVDWWVFGADRVAERREEMSPRYLNFHATVSEFFNLDDSNSLGIDLKELTTAQKWLLLQLLDHFIDLEILTDVPIENWQESWTEGMTFNLEAYELLKNNPEAIDQVKLDEVFSRLQAAE